MVQKIGEIDNCKFYDKHRGLWERLEEAHNPTLRDHGISSLKGEHDNPYLKGLLRGLNDWMHKNALNRTTHIKWKLLFLLN